MARIGRGFPARALIRRGAAAAGSTDAAITAATGAATASTIAGAASAAAAVTSAAGAATAPTLAGAAAAASAITPTAGVASAQIIAGGSFAQAAMTAAAGSSTASTMVPVGSFVEGNPRVWRVASRPRVAHLS